MLYTTTQSAAANLDRNIDYLQPLFESIMNSFEAGAKNIDIQIISASNLLETLESRMDGFDIIDDGEGFTKENIESFCTLWSRHKQSMGCKGSGRFTWLSVYHDIHIESEVASNQTKVSIPFSVSFRGKDDVTTNETNGLTKSVTKITFRTPDNKYTGLGRKNARDRRCFANSATIKARILDYLCVSLYHWSKERPDFCITINTAASSDTITAKDVENLGSRDFQMYNSESGQQESFSLKYVFRQDGKNRKSAYLCADKRSSHNITLSRIGICDRLPNDDSCVFFVTSDYLNSLDDDARRGLDYYASKNATDELYPIPYSTLLDEIAQEIKAVLDERYPALEEHNKQTAKELIEEKPYLARFVDLSKVGVASRRDLERLADNSIRDKKELVDQNFAKALKDRDLNPESFFKAANEVSEISSIELCRYVLYRSKILDALSAKSLSGKNEAYMHNIFIPMRTTYVHGNNQYLNTNLWIIDDKFMSFVYAASDINIKTITKGLSGEIGSVQKGLRRPDAFAAFEESTVYFNQLDDGNGKDAIIIEFKKYDASIDEKMKAFHEIGNHIAELKKANPSLLNVWAYIITKIDDEFADSIENFGSGAHRSALSRKAYYAFNEKLGAHIHVIDVETLISDAKLRNKVFSDILK